MVEGLADLIEAETSAQRKLALRQYGGELKKLYEKWREVLLKNLAHLEAFLDFGDEELLDENLIINQVRAEVFQLLLEIRKHLELSKSGERIRDGIEIVVAGVANVGKSSLINLICQRPAAIVSHLPGTTRDTV